MIEVVSNEGTSSQPSPYVGKQSTESDVDKSGCRIFGFESNVSISSTAGRSNSITRGFAGTAGLCCCGKKEDHVVIIGC